MTVEEVRRFLDETEVPYGTEVAVEPLDALVGQVAEAAGNVEILRRLVWELEPGFMSDGTGLAGPNHMGDGARHVLVRMYDEERERLARMAKLCVDAGVAQRQIDLAEQLGGQISRVMGAVASWVLARVRAGDDPDVIEAELPSEMRRQLTAVAQAS